MIGGPKRVNVDSVRILCFASIRMPARVHPNTSILAMLDAATPLVEMFAEMNWKMARFTDPV